MKGSIRIRNEKYSYYFKYKDENGKQKTKEKGGFATKKAAESAMRKAILDYEEKGAVAKTAKYTFSQYAEYWFEHIGEPSLAYKSIKTYRTVYNRHIKEDIGHLKLDKVTPATLQNLLTKIKKKQLGNSTIVASRNFIGNVFKLAITQKIVRESPLKSVVFQKTKKKKKEKRVLNENERSALLKAVEGTCYYAPFFIALSTGTRLGEVLGLLWEDVNFETNQISVNKQIQVQKGERVFTDTKTLTSTRAILMPARLSEYLQKIKKEQKEQKDFYKDFYYTGEDCICCRENGKPIPYGTVQSKVESLKKQTGIDFSFHDLRHTHAAMMLEADANIKVLQERLGHANISMTLDTYGHVTKRLEDQAIERFNSFF